MNPGDPLGLGLRIAVVLISGAVLLLHAFGLPANWILLAIALLYAWPTHFTVIGWGTLGALAALALLGEALEAACGPLVTARGGASRHGVIGSFLGGIAGALVAAPVVPPFGSMLGAFAGAFTGAALFEYRRTRDRAVALRAGRAAFIGRVLATAIKTFCGFWMWCLLAWRLLLGR